MKKTFFALGIFFILLGFYGFHAFEQVETNDLNYNLIKVNIAGAVLFPCEYEVSPLNKLEDLISYAGGLSLNADDQYLNYETLLTNNKSYYIPFIKEEIVDEGLININTANLVTLMTLPGVGESKAQAIIDYRNSVGLFKATSELVNVSGIGEKTYEQLHKKITV